MMDDRAVVDSELLAIQVYQLLDEKYPVPEILRPSVEQLIKLTVECTLEVMVEQLHIGERLP